MSTFSFAVAAHRRMLVLLALMLSLAAAGCTAVSEHQQGYELSTTLRAYEKAVRWADWSAVRGFFRTTDAESAARMYEQGRNLRMSAYHVLDAAADVPNGTAWQVVELRYYRIDSNVERQVIDKQSWVFDAARGAWLLDSPFPNLE